MILAISRRPSTRREKICKVPASRGNPGESRVPVKGAYNCPFLAPLLRFLLRLNLCCFLAFLFSRAFARLTVTYFSSEHMFIVFVSLMKDFYPKPVVNQ